MYEVDFLPVGDEGQSGDAVAVRLTRPDTGTYAHLIIDAGFQDDGEALVEHVQRWFETRSIDLAIVTHPDGDHIGGMGEVIRELDVGVLCIHRLRQRGGGLLPAADAVDELIRLAEARGTEIHEPFAGDKAFGGAMTILGPDEAWYQELVALQVEEEPRRALRRARSRLASLRAAGQRFLASLPMEIPFDDQGGTNPRNNTSVITMLDDVGHRMLLTGDAGVPSLERAWDWLELAGGDTSPPDFVQIPHAGSRHNASSAWLNRLLGPTGQAPSRTAFVSVASQAVRHPSPRVVNAYLRRGCRVYETRGQTKHHFGNGAPHRGWPPATPLDPMDESMED
jgi:beta-lactamase superfamily II metal-dependent hydrolase